MQKSHFITGATGFVGSYILIELLKQTTDTIYCLVRPKENQQPADRMFNLLEALIPTYEESTGLMAEARQRVQIVVGDLSEKVLDVANDITHPISCFWHVAASLNYEERYAEQIFETNVMGTRYALRLAEKLQTEYFNHFSTAYVVGKQEGILFEKPVLKIDSNNVYERTKVTAEHEVLENTAMKTRIFRPSIVIGHSKTMRAFNFSGMYGFIRRLVQFREMMEDVEGWDLEHNSIKMKIDPSVELNLVPIDKVASEAVSIGITDTAERIFNLTNTRVMTVGDCINMFFEVAGLTPPEIVNTKESFSWIDEKFNAKMEFYNSYLVGQKWFDRTNTNTAINDFSNNLQHAITPDKLLEYCQWYVNRLEEERQAVPVSR